MRQGFQFLAIGLAIVAILTIWQSLLKYPSKDLLRKL